MIATLLQDAGALADGGEGPRGPLAVILLAVVQGLAEFLPVSSSGHLALGRLALGLQEAGLALDVALHVGTLAAVIVAFRADVARLFRDLLAGRLRMWAWLSVATVPAGIVGVLFADVFEAASHSARAVAFGLFATSAVLLLGERARRAFEDVGFTRVVDGGLDGWGRPTFGLALYLGCAQACAIWPGISRSGSTIAAGLVRGLAAEEAARYSFLMSLPAVSGAACMTLPRAMSEGFGEVSPGWVAVGAAIAGVVGFLALKTLLLVLRRGSFPWFAAYTAALGAVALVLAP